MLFLTVLVNESVMWHTLKKKTDCPKTKLMKRQNKKNVTNFLVVVGFQTFSKL